MVVNSSDQKTNLADYTKNKLVWPDIMIQLLPDELQELCEAIANKCIEIQTRPHKLIEKGDAQADVGGLA